MGEVERAVRLQVAADEDASEQSMVDDDVDEAKHLASTHARASTNSSKPKQWEALPSLVPLPSQSDARSPSLVTPRARAGEGLDF